MAPEWAVEEEGCVLDPNQRPQGLPLISGDGAYACRLYRLSRHWNEYLSGRAADSVTALFAGEVIAEPSRRVLYVQVELAGHTVSYRTVTRPHSRWRLPVTSCWSEWLQPAVRSSARTRSASAASVRVRKTQIRAQERMEPGRKSCHMGLVSDDLVSPRQSPLIDFVQGNRGAPSRQSPIRHADRQRPSWPFRAGRFSSYRQGPVAKRSTACRLNVSPRPGRSGSVM